MILLEIVPQILSGSTIGSRLNLILRSANELLMVLSNTLYYTIHFANFMDVFAGSL